MSKLIIFDCDGVLVDSEIIGNRVYAQILSECGYPASTEDCIKKFTGISDATMRDLILAESGIAVPFSDIDLAQQRTVEAFENELRPLIDEVLEYIFKMGFKKCIASSSPKERISRALQITKQDHFFSNELVFNAAQVKRGKPAPDLFLFAAKQMNAHPKDCLVIEDSVAGIQAAKNAEMNVIGFMGASHTHFDWYRDKVSQLNVPVAFNSGELLLQIQNFCLA